MSFIDPLLTYTVYITGAIIVLFTFTLLGIWIHDTWNPPKRKD